jgi:hypothetical protein
MSSEPAYPSSMDEREFFDDLQNLVSEPPGAPGVREVRRSLDVFEDVLAADEGEGLAGRLAPTADRVAVMWPEHLEERIDRAEPVVVRFPVAVAVSGLLLCAATGAGVSALVFHDRVSQLLALWTR